MSSEQDDFTLVFTVLSTLRDECMKLSHDLAARDDGMASHA